MAARVNVRFVVILCSIVGVVFVGMAGAAYFIVKKSADDHYQAGIALYQAGDFVEAEKSLAKAVNKDRTNILYLEKWIDTIEKLVPPSQVQYTDMYWKNYMPGLRGLAMAKRTDAKAWDRYLQVLYRQQQALGGSSRAGWVSLLNEATVAISYFQSSSQADDDDAPWHGLRRYRALANLNMMIASGEPDPEFRNQTVTDFEAALRVEPRDAASAVGLYEWLMTEAEKARSTVIDPEVYLEQARQVLDDFLAHSPTHPRVRLARLFYDLQMDARPIRQLRTQEETLRAQRALAEAYAPRVRALVEDLLQRADPLELGVEVVSMLQRLERATTPQAGIPLTQRVFEAALAAHRDNPGLRAQLHFFEGVFLSETGSHERAIEAFTRVVDSSPIPVSLEGIILSILRQQAVLQRVSSAIDLAARATEGTRPAARERVAQLRRVADEFFAQGSTALLLLDARINYLNGNLVEAQRLAIKYQTDTGASDPEGFYVLSGIYMDRNQPGLALDQLKRYVELRPNAALAWATLSTLQERLGDRKSAMESIEKAASLAPDDAGIQNLYNAMLIESGQRVASDPIEQVLVQASRLMDTTGGRAPRYEEVVALLRQTIARERSDPRVYNMLGTVLGMQRRFEEAIRVVEQGLTNHPGNEMLQGLRGQLAMLSTPDEAESRIRAQFDGVRAEIMLYQLFTMRGETEKAQIALDAAQRLDPDDGQVIQVLFGRALDSKDFQTAQALADKAARLNVDQAGGRVLRAMLLHSQGRSTEALSMIDSVIAEGLSSVPILYRRAQILRGLGRVEDAVRAYEEALRIQPDSIGNIREVISALAEMGRTRRALEVARQSQRIAGADELFVQQWLALEGEVGDATLAMLRREAIRDTAREDRRNNLVLADLYVKLGEWAKARTLIDELRSKDDALELVLLDARWHAQQGNTPRALGVFEQYLAGKQHEDALGVRDVLTYSNFLQGRGQTNRAIAVLRGSLQLDPPDHMPMRRSLAVLLLTSGRSAEAIGVIDELIASGQDKDGSLRLGRIEALIRGGRLDEAQSALDGLDAPLARHENAGILRTDLALRRGDRRAARQALSNTLAVHPTSARAYTRRAELIWTDLQDADRFSAAERTELLRDAAGDLTEAIKHDPSIWEAHRLLGVMALRAQRFNDAADAFERTIEINPGMSPLRSLLVQTMVEAGRTAEAMALIDRAAQANPSDTELRVDMARLLADLGRHDEATRLFEAALAQRRSADTASQLVEHLINRGTPEARSKARQVLADPNLNVAGTWQLLLMSARLSVDDGNRARAVLQARQSFELVRQDANAMIRWFNVLPALLKDQALRMEIALQLEVQRTPERLGEVMLASLMLSDPSTREQGLRELNRLAGDRDLIVAERAGQLLGDTLYARDDFQGAASAWRQVIRINPNASQSLNNLAYVLATELGQCQEAVDLARRAIEAGGVAPTISRSTLVVALVACQRGEEARQVADELAAFAKGTPDEALAAIRMGQVEKALGKIEQARAQFNEAKGLIESWSPRADRYLEVLEKAQRE